MNWLGSFSQSRLRLRWERTEAVQQQQVMEPQEDLETQPTGQAGPGYHHLDEVSRPKALSLLGFGYRPQRVADTLGIRLADVELLGKIERLRKLGVPMDPLGFATVDNSAKSERRSLDK